MGSYHSFLPGMRNLFIEGHFPHIFCSFSNRLYLGMVVILYELPACPVPEAGCRVWPG